MHVWVASHEIETVAFLIATVAELCSEQRLRRWRRGQKAGGHAYYVHTTVRALKRRNGVQCGGSKPACTCQLHSTSTSGGDLNLSEKNSYRYDKNASQPVNHATQTAPPPLSQQNDKTATKGRMEIGAGFRCAHNR
eukprot:6185179-Pleurochrysis_carterae.AAC.1